MSNPTPLTVTTTDGRQAVIAHPAEMGISGEPHVPLQFENGQELLAPTDLLLQQDDGNFHLPISFDELVQRQADLQ